MSGAPASGTDDGPPTLYPLSEEGDGAPSGGGNAGDGAPDAPEGDGSALRVSEVLASLSYALDITEGQPEGHSIRSTLIGMRLGQEIGLSRDRRSALFYALLLKDLGCSSNAAKVSYLFGSDDHATKSDLKTRDWSSLSGAVGYVLDNVARNGSWWDRLGGLVRILLNGGPAAARELVRIRCERGADIARMLGFPEETVRAIHDLDEHWDGGGHPAGKEGEEIPLGARILNLAQTVDVFLQEYDHAAVYEMAADRRGTWFDPDLVDGLRRIRGDDAFWGALRADDLREELKRWEPADRAVEATDERLDLIGRAFARVVDAKSPWTYRHSERVTDLAVEIGRRLGMEDGELRTLRRAALLHDIGKLGISNMILDKEGQLTEKEFEEVKEHPAYSDRILRRVSAFREVAEIAARHHERLDGSGYFRGLERTRLSTPERVLAVADVYEALTADRPYRDAFAPDHALGILRDDAGTALDEGAVDALESVLEARPDLARQARAGPGG